MTLDEAGRLQEAWKAKHPYTVCKHGRVVDYLASKTGRTTGYLVCRECGEAFIDPLKQISPTDFKTLEELSAEGG